MSDQVSFPPNGGAAESPALEAVGAVSAPEPAKKGKKQIDKTIVGPRRVRLSLTRVDPLSVMKVSFLVSVAVGIMMIVAAAFVWFMLDAMHVFSTIKELVGAVMDTEDNAYSALLEYMKFTRSVAMATVVAVVNVVLSTAMATIGAFLYNVIASLVGGVHLTLADE